MSNRQQARPNLIPEKVQQVLRGERMAATASTSIRSYLITEFPDYLDSQTRRHIRRAALCRIWGHCNVYLCEMCGGRLVTTDLDEGTTPFTIRCRAQNCNGTAVSQMYRLDPGARWRPTHGWYRPTSLDGFSPDTQHHIRQGGLILRELTRDEVSVL